jgi:hypothetical protein
MLWIILSIIAIIYALGWGLSAAYLILHDHYNKWFYLGLALLWPVYVLFVFDLIRMKAWK